MHGEEKESLPTAQKYERKSATSDARWKKNSH